MGCRLIHSLNYRDSLVQEANHTVKCKGKTDFFQSLCLSVTWVGKWLMVYRIPHLTGCTESD